ncbi:ABC transporter permease, partial [Mycobacterium tuberculosis]
MNTRSIDSAVPGALGAPAASADPEYIAWAAARQKRIW